MLTKVVLVAEALVMLVAGSYLFFIDRFKNPAWPWQPDLVSARIMSGFPLAWTAWAVTLALAPTWGEARAGVFLNIIWLGTILASVLVFRSQFDLRRRTVQVYSAVTTILLLALAGVYLAQG